MNEILKISDLKVAYDNEPPVLDNVNLRVYENDFLGIIGPNGGGKTTLLKAILGLIRPKTGKIEFFRNGERQQQLNIGYLPQTNQIDKNFPISVYDVILSGITIENKFLIRYSKQQKQKVSDIAEQMGLSKLLKRPIGELSGGQLQRVLLGRAIVDETDLLVLDEPNSYVDKRFETNFYHILAELNKTMAIIIVSHDIGTVISQVKNIACVNGGLHYHAGSNISTDWLGKYYASCPIEILGHGNFPHRILENHDGCDCCNSNKMT